MGNLEGKTQKKKAERDFDREFDEYINGFYENYSNIDEYSTGNHCDLMNEALLLGIDVSKRKLATSDINKIKRYNRDK